MPLVESDFNARITTAAELSHIEKNLPNPVRQFRVGAANFSVYQAKSFYTHTWLSDNLKRLTVRARHSYLRYGSVPLLDEYDTKASVYVCSVSYLAENDVGPAGTITEWVSMRFIPADGVPVLTDDLAQYFFKDSSIGDWLLQTHSIGEEIFRRVVTISRLCGFSSRGVHEYARHTPLRYTALAFLFINFCAFSNSDTAHVDYITAVFHEQFFKKILDEIYTQSEVVLPTPRMEEYLGCTPGDVRLKRKIMTYRFPTYFLPIKELTGFLVKLLDGGQLTEATLEQFVTNFSREQLSDWGDQSHVELTHNLTGLGNLFSHVGPIPASPLTGEELRVLIDKEVGDGPKLHFISAPEWRAQVALAVQHIVS